MAPPFRQVEFDIMYGEGVSREAGLLDCGVEIGVVEKSGSWFSYGENRLGQGRDNSRLYLKDNPHLAEQLEQEILAHHGLVAPIGNGQEPLKLLKLESSRGRSRF